MADPTTGDYLAALYAGCEGVLELRAFPRQAFAPLADLDPLRAFVRQHRGENLYHGMATRKDYTSGTADNCFHLPCLFADLDLRNEKHPNAPTEAEGRATLAGCPLPPSIVVASGGGLYPIWLLREPFDLQDADDRTTASDLLRRLCRYLGADDGARDVARVLRLPGTRNHKYDPPRPVIIETFEPERRYNPGDFEDWLPTLPREARTATTSDGATVGQGKRNAHLASLAGTMRRRGLSPAAILAALRVANTEQCDPPLDAAEVERIAASVGRYAPAGEEDRPPDPAPREMAPAAPVTLDAALTTFRTYLHLTDPAPVYALAATLVANVAPGDPVWVLLVAPPSAGKTEILSAATALPWVHSAAKVTEASLLSGTSKRERAKGATGGLLRQIGAFGVLLVKDFTSVLAQNHDARNEAMAALREVYDGSWHRPIGTDGGQVLVWQGKCGLIGGVTPALDQYGQVLAALGDRFLLLRLPDADVDAFGTAALNHADHEGAMRAALREALAGLVAHADTSQVNRTRSAAEQKRLITLAAYACRVRTAVARDGYRQDVLYQPQVEGPGRVVKALARLLGGLEAIGCDEAAAWATLTRMAVDCAPALRTTLIRELVKRTGPARTSDLAAAVDMVTKTAARHLEDLALLRVATHSKRSPADNAPDYWEASPWLREHWPAKSETEKYPPAHKPQEGEVDDAPPAVPPGVDFSPTFDSSADTWEEAV